LANKEVGAILTIVGGVFYLIGSFAGAIVISAFFAGFSAGLSGSGPPATGGLSSFFGPEFYLILAAGAATGILIIVSGALLLSDEPGRRRKAGILAIAMMIVGALPTVGGALIGFVLTLVGAILGLTYKADIEASSARLSAPAGAVAGANLQGLRYCTGCGAPLDQSAKFCPSCGTKVPFVG
jgi:hypothetical protein